MEPVDCQAAIDSLIDGFFRAFDNRDGRTPDLAPLLACFADKAVIARVAGLDVELLSATEFALPRIELLTGGGLVDFHEAETSSTTHILGKIAIRTSRYRKSGLLHEVPYQGAGTKTFQLIAFASGWRIVSLAWMDDEVNSNPSDAGQGSSIKQGQ